MSKHSCLNTIKGIFLAAFDYNFGFRNQRMVFSTCENVGEIFETLRRRD